jgi:hypothetical protein
VGLVTNARLVSAWTWKLSTVPFPAVADGKKAVLLLKPCLWGRFLRVSKPLRQSVCRIDWTNGISGGLRGCEALNRPVPARLAAP